LRWEGVLAFIGGEGETPFVLARLGADGTTTPLVKIGEGFAPGEVSQLGWQRRGDFIAAVFALHKPKLMSGYEYLLADSSGRVVLHRTSKDEWNPWMYLAEDGTLAVSAEHSFVARADGSVIELGEYRPIAPMLRGGWLPVAIGRPTNEDAGPHGLLEVATMKFVELREAHDSYSGFHSAGDALVYSSAKGLEIVRASGAERIDAPGQQISSVSESRVLLSNGTKLEVVDLTTHQRTPLKLDAGQVWLDCKGELLWADNAQLKRSTDRGATWKNVGAPMAPGPQFGGGAHLRSFSGAAGTLVLGLSAGYGYYVNSAQLVSGEHAATVEMGSVYVNGDLDPTAAAISPDGTCAAAWTGPEGKPLDLVFFDALGHRKAAMQYGRFVPITF
jgi:hypothetical protein